MAHGPISDTDFGSFRATKDPQLKNPEAAIETLTLDDAATASAGSALSDQAGIIASVACAVHCAAMPLVLSYLPVLGLGWLADESFHRVMTFVCFGLAICAFVPGWRRHGSLAPACVGALGLSIIAYAAFALEGECCPTCVAQDTEATATPVSAAAASAAPPSSGPACTDEHCSLCAAEAETAPFETTQEPTEGPIAAWAIPFITPLGGGLLVAGHLINRQKSCQCTGDGCCLPTTGGPEA